MQHLFYFILSHYLVRTSELQDILVVYFKYILFQVTYERTPLLNQSRQTIRPASFSLTPSCLMAYINGFMQI